MIREAIHRSAHKIPSLALFLEIKFSLTYKISPLYIPVVKKQVLSAPGQAWRIQLVEKPAGQSEPTIGTEFSFRAGTRMGKEEIGDSRPPFVQR